MIAKTFELVNFFGDGNNFVFFLKQVPDTAGYEIAGLAGLLKQCGHIRDEIAREHKVFTLNLKQDRFQLVGYLICSLQEPQDIAPGFGKQRLAVEIELDGPPQIV